MNMIENPTFIIVYLYTLVFLFGVVIGSFLNVLINRIPRKESFVKVPSHCESCGYRLQWYDLVPLFSYIFLGGKCRKCKAKISIQHPLIEGLNGLLYVLIFYKYGLSLETLLFCLLTSALIALSMIDFRTFEIPFGFNIFIFCLGVVRLAFNLSDWKEYVIGFFIVSLFLELLVVLSKGAAMGGGDVKLMATCGFILGWKLILFAFVVGLVSGSVIHVSRIIFTKADRTLAFGPYLSIGVFSAIMWGDIFLRWYIGLAGF